MIDILNKCHTGPRFINNDYLSVLFMTLKVQDQGRIQQLFIGGGGGGRKGPNLGSERTVELFLWQITFHREDHAFLNL